MYTEDKSLLYLVKKHAPEGGFYKNIVEIKPTELVELTGMEWHAGFKTHYVAVHLSDGRYVVLEPGKQYAKLSPSTAVIAYEWAGTGKTVKVFLHREDVARFLHYKDTRLTANQLAILYCTKLYQNTYGGQTDIRRREAARAGYYMSHETWRDEQNRLIKLGYLDRRGSLTQKGRNAAPSRLEYLV